MRLKIPPMNAIRFLSIRKPGHPAIRTALAGLLLAVSWSGSAAEIAKGRLTETPGVVFFPLRDVRIQDGPFKAAQAADRAYMLALDVDKLLAPFRREAGLPQKAR